jgi:hypothetical protein
VLTSKTPAAFKPDGLETVNLEAVRNRVEYGRKLEQRLRFGPEAVGASQWRLAEMIAEERLAEGTLLFTRGTSGRSWMVVVGIEASLTLLRRFGTAIRGIDAKHDTNAHKVLLLLSVLLHVLVTRLTRSLVWWRLQLPFIAETVCSQHGKAFTAWAAICTNQRGETVHLAHLVSEVALAT